MRVNGKISWYGGVHDAQDNNQTFTGIPNESVAGIATPYDHTKKGWWLLTDPKSGQQHVVRDIEKGPAAFTGRKFDLNPNAAALFGWEATDAKFPTDRELHGVYLGKNIHRVWRVKRSLQGGAQAKQPRQTRPAPRGLAPADLAAALTAIRAGAI